MPLRCRCQGCRTSSPCPCTGAKRNPREAPVTKATCLHIDLGTRSDANTSISAPRTHQPVPGPCRLSHRHALCKFTPCIRPETGRPAPRGPWTEHPGPCTGLEGAGAAAGQRVPKAPAAGRRRRRFQPEKQPRRACAGQARSARARARPRARIRTGPRGACAGRFRSRAGFEEAAAARAQSGLSALGTGGRRGEAPSARARDRLRARARAGPEAGHAHRA